MQPQNRFQTVNCLLTDYICRTKDKQSLATFAERQRLLADFATTYGEANIDGLIADDLDRWIDAHPGWLSDWTQLRAVNTVKRVFNWAWKKGLITRNPFAEVTRPTGPRGVPMPEKDFRAIAAAAEPELRRLLWFLRWTGARPGELADMTWGCIDLAAGTITLIQHKTARSRKDRQPRVIYLPAKAIRLLAWICKGRRSNFVFVNRYWKKWRRGNLSLRIYRIRRRLGIPHTSKLYGVRHAWASQLAANGVELKMLATLLGHTSARMAEHYIHLFGKTQVLRQELEKGLAGKR